jgi:hypothetical protein
MSNLPPRSYFLLCLNRKADIPWDWVEINFSRKHADPFHYMWNSFGDEDAEEFWARLEKAGVWEWTTWAEGTGGVYLAIRGALFNRCVLRISHGGRERDIYLDDQPEKIAVLRSLLEPLASSADKCGVADCKYCVLTPSQVRIRMKTSDFQKGDAYDIDFDRMEFSHATDAHRIKNASTGSIAGYDADGFWERLAAAGAWDWPAEHSCRCCDCRRRRDAKGVDLLTLRHAGRERRINEPDKLLQVIDMLKPLTLGSLSVVINPSEPERCVHIEVAPDGPGVRIDFGRMEVVLREKGEIYWGFSADGRPTALRHRSIRGFDEAAFWRRVSASAAWEAKPFFEDWHDAKSVPLAEGSLSIEMRNGVSFMRAKYACGPRRQLELLLKLLRPLSLDAMWAVVAPARCDFSFEPVRNSGRRPGIRHSGAAAIRAIDELVSLGVHEWDEGLPANQADQWDEAEWETVEGELNDGRPYVPPVSRSSRCRRVNERSEENAWGYVSPPKEGVHIPPSNKWQLKGVRDTLRISQRGLVQDRLRADATVGCGDFYCCGLYWANSRKFTLLRRLLLSTYGETFVPPPAWSAQANDVWSSEANYYYEARPASYAIRHDYWLNLTPADPCSIVLEGRSEEEIFSYEFSRSQKPPDLLPLEACPRPPAVGIMRVHRRSLATGAVWTVERPLSSPCLDRLGGLLEVAGVSKWADAPGWPGNTWRFHALLNGKTYECGGIAATGGGIESPEPDPRLAVLRKILHFAG